MANTSTTVLTRKQREKLFKRSEILRAAQQVFAAKGYEHSTIEEIAEKAEFSKGALYNYFSNKEEMFIALLDEGFREFERIVEAAFPDNRRPLKESFAEFTMATLAYFEDNPDYLTIIFKENLQMKIKLLAEFRVTFNNRRQCLVQRIAKRLNQAMKSKTIRKMDATMLVEVFWNIIFAFLLHIRCGSDKGHLKKDAETILTIFFAGVELK